MKFFRRKTQEEKEFTETLKKLISSANAPKITPKVPLYRNPEDKRAAFKVIEGKKK